MLGLMLERLLIRRLYGRDPLYSLLLTFGLAFMFQDAHALHLGGATCPSNPGLAGLAALHRLLLPDRLPHLHGRGGGGGGRAVLRVLGYTRLGMRIRAGTVDLETVSVLGVNVRLLRNLNFGLGIYLAGLAGVLAAGMLGL